MKIEDLILRIKRRWMKMRLQPIRVLCFHQVSEAFDESYMEPIDWLETDVFKQRIEGLQQEGYVFISLPEAQEKMKRDRIRCKKYVVLTADDGWATLRNVLPWLKEHQIPLTLFLNPTYLDGTHFRNSNEEQYLNITEVEQIHNHYPLVTIGSHGWEHVAATEQTGDEFLESVNKTTAYLRKMPNYIPFHAYTWGRYSSKTNSILKEVEITPVYMDGEKNYNDSYAIHRELL